MGTNNNCHDCGCGPSIPEPCITPPPACPNPQPCTEVISAECIVYPEPPSQPTPLMARAATPVLRLTDVITQLNDNTIANAEATSKIIASSQIHIPSLTVSTVGGKVFAAFDFYNSNEWQNYNPKIYLFRKRKAKNSRTRKNFRTAKFVHPTNAIPSKETTKFWNGSAQYSEFPFAPITRKTEFELPKNVTPYKMFSLEELGLNKYEWCTVENTSDNYLDLMYALPETGDSVNTVAIRISDVNNYPAYEFTDQNGRTYTLTTSNGSDYNVVFDGMKIAQSESGVVNNSAYSIGKEGYLKGLWTQNFKQIKEVATPDIFAELSKKGAKEAGPEAIGNMVKLNSKNNLKNKHYNQNIYFKLAVVIENPDATSDVPYLIGPMSDAFALKFVITDKAFDLGFTLATSVNRIIS